MGDAGLAALRSLVSDPRPGGGQVRVPLGHDGADETLGGGLPKGVLREVFAHESGHGGAAASAPADRPAQAARIRTAG